MKILMVCLGNICRSPMADGLLRNIVAERGMDVKVDSAGTSGYHIGDPPDNRMIQTAEENNIDITSLRARQLIPDDLDEFDLIFAMDQDNYRNILKFANDTNRKKVKLILNEIFPDENLEVPDPYFGGSAGFDHVFTLLRSACNKIADNINKGVYS